MLENPVFVRWCTSCGREAPEEEDLTCPHCSGSVERYQRVLELPDNDEGDATFALHSLRAALAEIASDNSVTAAAVVLSDHGVDPLVAQRNPDFAAQLVALEVPPCVQQALLRHGFISFEQVCEAVSALSEPSAWAEQLGLSPAAEVLLRRLWHAAREAHQMQLGREQKREQASDDGDISHLSVSASSSCNARAAPPKRLRFPRHVAMAEAMARELALSPGSCAVTSKCRQPVETITLKNIITKPVTARN